MDNITIYHNPRCSKSRQTLQLLREYDLEPQIILYMEQPLSEIQIRELLKKLGLSARQLLRDKEKVCRELGLHHPETTDELLISSMSREPRLIQRPIVVSGENALLGRPPERVLELLNRS